MSFRAAWIPNRRKETAPLEYANRVATIITELDKARKGITACFCLFLALAVGIFPFSERALEVLVSLFGRKLVSFSPEEGFLALASLSVYCAFVLTLPVAGFLLWRGAVLPRVPAWRKWSLPVFAAARPYSAASLVDSAWRTSGRCFRAFATSASTSSAGISGSSASAA